jgi:predicted O-methyltransferase YrrM
MPRIRDLIYRGHDPYAGWPKVARDDKPVVGWNSDHPLFREVLTRWRPSFFFELGTLLGASAIHMARIARALPLATEIICIDTYLGAPENWGVGLNPAETLDELALYGGRPQIYEGFIENVLRTGVDDLLTPCPMSTATAAKVLRGRGAPLADVIYVDAGHDYVSVRGDLESFWPLLRPGGAMFGDDYDAEAWPGVVAAVQEFFHWQGVDVQASSGPTLTPLGPTLNTKWLAIKPR